MRSIVFGLMVAGGALMAAPPAPVQGQVSAGVVLDRDGLRHFHLALGQVYGVPVQSISSWHPSWLHHDELPVIYLLAREARVSPEVVIALRQNGWSWIDITEHLRVDPYVFVAHLPSTSYGSYGPYGSYRAPRGYAHGYWKKPSRSHLRRLSDRHIIDYVNVYFWATAHRRPVTEVIVIRERAPTWTHYVRAEAPRVRFQEPSRAQPVSVQPAPATRPAQPRGTTPSAAPRSAPRAAPQVAPRSTTTVRGTTPAPAASRMPNPAANRTPAPAANRTPNPAASRAPAPAASRSPVPAAGRAPASSTRGSTPPAASRAPAQRSGRTPPPASRGRGGG